MRTINLSHSKGYRLYFANNLLGFLANREPRTEQFHLSDWLTTLSDVDLEEFVRDMDRAMTDEDAADVATDIFATYTNAFAAEKGTLAFSTGWGTLVEKIGQLRMLTTIEQLSRVGVIDMHLPFSISSDDVITYRLTKKGKEMGDLFARFQRTEP